MISDVKNISHIFESKLFITLPKPSVCNAFAFDICSICPANGLTKTSIPKKRRAKKTREINLYSPEYLEKKHGINLNTVKINKDLSTDKKISFGFYNALIFYVVIIIALSRVLFFFQDLIAQYMPFTKFYLDYFFENIRNIFEIFKNLVSNH